MEKSTSFPSEEKFCLIDQLRRAAVTITSNIAEGFNRKTPLDKIHFYYTAISSVSEIQSQLYIAHDLQYITVKTFSNLMSESVEIHKLINGLIKYMKNHT
ncbi:hypothetical protein A2334_01655 [Candidatus Roizmanbacteria bacterium RIFOXYB2_FULL_38_10]|uniref:Four helix bundle protein n=1 Tax=Candidatus Roizmanbacteria bacterium RIFOXYD1_FULL_38_12 TaxID=1802093 RepID=A0A1F7L1V1_9BACT|nr:MAG: hypothetical protein A3K47_04715 [Candidatus Roizmanbacteria bacterium RIFOXYA2_FULL_38_14]OGK64053.1 MAG: hypothetical protein A3K27_04715 [Candidatus Roizmanbacteria bacterium RIFOXYA1_FULL_37_12]OGK65899.1 MAG: hypothetical protein A3K38_04715 [Candidatus Roizmanbacteria bacterium RIFOXYB1_FULL_40_23]OGK68052.1 MAG: hypothetical protein A2334_01655 [Candidatus Roizmanbacteria bacterium RIFOXYB2_FULL_38_10]OGK70304.1 MAG: hypothetical protein A3K21_04720 [Candidatus Roizmanbacteria ba